ncbi:MAG: YceI family protein [Phycisphaeraceae bacterium]
MQALILLLTAGTLTATLSTCVLTGPPAPPVTPPTSDRKPNEQVSQTTLTLAEGSAIRLAGSATVGSWDCAGYQAHATFAPGTEIRKLHAWIDHLETDLANNGRSEMNGTALPLAHAPRASLQMAIEALGCGNAAMERDMQGALKASEHPDITYELDRVVDVQWELSPETERPVFHLTTQGHLSLAGQSQPIEMDVRIERVEEARFALLGRKELDMADFDIQPPSALFGLIRAHPTVTVVFDLVVEPQSEAPAAERPATP